MGAWGTGIYSNDTAEDVRDACNDIFAVYDAEVGNELLFAHFGDILNQGFEDNEYASFWYALADWQWKHGMLNEFVKEKALSLLEKYAGIEEWIEEGNKTDIGKRRKTMENLKNQLLCEQGVLKKPNLRLAKPKHNVGDIVVFKANDYADEPDSHWHISDFRPPFMFSDGEIAESAYEDVDGIAAHGKYTAILCIGDYKVPHSEYLSNMYDEYSVYAWYDFLSETAPTADELKYCGFLPFVDLQWEDFNRNILSKAVWMYKFILYSEKFKTGNELTEVYKFKAPREVSRFSSLLSFKNYSDDIFGSFTLYEMFAAAFEEKSRMSMLKISVDNLLDTKALNPDLLQSDGLQKAYKEYMQGLDY